MNFQKKLIVVALASVLPNTRWDTRLDGLMRKG